MSNSITIQIGQLTDEQYEGLTALLTPPQPARGSAVHDALSASEQTFEPAGVGTLIDGGISITFPTAQFAPEYPWIEDVGAIRNLIEDSVEDGDIELEIEYASVSRDEVTQRVIIPTSIESPSRFPSFGRGTTDNDYVVAVDVAKDEPRTFRLRNIRKARYA